MVKIVLNGVEVEVSEDVASAIENDDCRSAEIEGDVVVLHWDHDNSSPMLCVGNDTIEPVETYHYGERAIYHIPFNATY
jgi:hypothetical protein